jgi:hypothetical protein
MNMLFFKHQVGCILKFAISNLFLLLNEFPQTLIFELQLIKWNIVPIVLQKANSLQRNGVSINANGEITIVSSENQMVSDKASRKGENYVLVYIYFQILFSHQISEFRRRNLQLFHEKFELL